MYFSQIISGGIFQKRWKRRHFDLCEKCYDEITEKFLYKINTKIIQNCYDFNHLENGEGMLDVCLLGTGGMMPLPRRWLTALMCRYNGKIY